MGFLSKVMKTSQMHSVYFITHNCGPMLSACLQSEHYTSHKNSLTTVNARSRHTSFNFIHGLPIIDWILDRKYFFPSNHVSSLFDMLSVVFYS